MYYGIYKIGDIGYLPMGVKMLETKYDYTDLQSQMDKIHLKQIQIALMYVIFPVKI